MIDKVTYLLVSGYFLLLTILYFLIKASVFYLPTIVYGLYLPISCSYELIATACSYFLEFDLNGYFKTAISLEEIKNIKQQILLEDAAKLENNESEINNSNKIKTKSGFFNYFYSYELMILAVSPIAVIICILRIYQ